jgi:TRAP-type C4-dicarboxylate transport system permease small subunit
MGPGFRRENNGYSAHPNLDPEFFTGSNPEMMQPATSAYLKGAVFGFAAVSIWASWSVVTRLAATTSLDGWDIVALRFGVAGLLLSPVIAQRGLARNRLGWVGLAVIIAGTGAPYALVAASSCALHRPTMAARSIRVACRCSLL